MTTMTKAGTDLTALAASGKLAQNAEPGKGFPMIPDEWCAEPKYDGWRILAVIGDDGVTMFSRSGKTYSGKLPMVEAELMREFPVGTVLDGEAVAITRHADGAVTNEWGTTQSVLTKVGGHAAASKVTYMIFDLIAHGGIDARPLPYVNRRSLLEQIFENGTFQRCALTNVLPATEDTYDALVEAGWEGAIFKKLDAPYASGQRGKGWMKAKATTTVDVVVMGFKPGQGGFTGLIGAVVFGQYDDDGNLVERGRCSGMDMRTRVAITGAQSEWMGKVIEVRHMGVLNGNFRHPQFARPRPDKAAEQITLHDK